MNLFEVSFRRALPADAACLTALSIQVFVDTYAVDGLRADLAREALACFTLARSEARIADRGSLVLVAERAGSLLGFADSAPTCELPLHGLEEGWELLRLYVPHRWQRMGLGAGLLAGVEDYTQAQGARCLWLGAWAGNTNACAFYLAQGYEDVGAVDYFIEAQAHQNRIFRKRLAGGAA